MKFYFFAVMIVGLMIILAAAGYDLPVSGGLMNVTGIIDKTVDNPDGAPDVGDFKNDSNPFWIGWIALIGFGVAGIVIGVFGRTPDINLLSASLVGLLSGAILTDYIAIMVKISSFNVVWIQWSMGALFSVLIVGFFITMIQFWRGSD